MTQIASRQPSTTAFGQLSDTAEEPPPLPAPPVEPEPAPAPAPEVPENVNVDELGNLGLTSEEEDALVAFMSTLSDGFTDEDEKD